MEQKLSSPEIFISSGVFKSFKSLRVIVFFYFDLKGSLSATVTLLLRNFACTQVHFRGTTIILYSDVLPKYHIDVITFHELLLLKVHKSVRFVSISAARKTTAYKLRHL